MEEWQSMRSWDEGNDPLDCCCMTSWSKASRCRGGVILNKGICEAQIGVLTHLTVLCSVWLERNHNISCLTLSPCLKEIETKLWKAKRSQTEQIEKCSKFEVKGWQSSGQLESAANCRLGPWPQLVPQLWEILDCSFILDLQVNWLLKIPLINTCQHRSRKSQVNRTRFSRVVYPTPVVIVLVVL